MDMSSETLLSDFEKHLHHAYGYALADVIPSGSRGYWDVLRPCPGGEGCRHAFRGELGPCEGGGKLSVGYYDSARERGRFVSPYRTWLAHREALQTGGKG